MGKSFKVEWLVGGIVGDAKVCVCVLVSLCTCTKSKNEFICVCVCVCVCTVLCTRVAVLPMCANEY